MLLVALLAARPALGEQLSKLEKRVRSLARDDRWVRRPMSAPGVGAVVALTFVAAIALVQRMSMPRGFISTKAIVHCGAAPAHAVEGEPPAAVCRARSGLSCTQRMNIW